MSQYLVKWRPLAGNGPHWWPFGTNKLSMTKLYRTDYNTFHIPDLYGREVWGKEQIKKGGDSSIKNKTKTDWYDKHYR